jgi:hypothetical protein
MAAYVYWPPQDQVASVAAQLRTTLNGVGGREEGREFAATLDDDEAKVGWWITCAGRVSTSRA